MKTGTLDRLREARENKQAVCLVTRLKDATEALVFEDTVEGDLDAKTVEAARDALLHDRSTTIGEGDERRFLHAYNPPLRMAIIGAVHIAQPLCRMAPLAGYDVTVIDPRGAFATADRFPGVHLVDDWPDEALEAFGLDSRTAVVTLTHDPKIDDPALQVALRSRAFYVGSLGGRKTHGSRIERLKEAGFGDNEIGRIHAPIGLPLGGRAPAEIAIAIMAEITNTLHGGRAAG